MERGFGRGRVEKVGQGNGYLLIETDVQSIFGQAMSPMQEAPEDKGVHCHFTRETGDVASCSNHCARSLPSKVRACSGSCPGNCP